MLKILENLLTLQGPATTEIDLTPKIKVYVDTRMLDQNKDKILSFCNDIPDVDLSGKNLMRRHLNQDEFYTLLLIALGDKIGAWERFPSHKIEWNIPDWPYAIRKKKLRSTAS